MVGQLFFYNPLHYSLLTFQNIDPCRIAGQVKRKGHFITLDFSTMESVTRKSKQKQIMEYFARMHKAKLFSIIKEA